MVLTAQISACASSHTHKLSKRVVASA